MPIRNAIWTVEDVPTPLHETKLPSEKALEDLIVAKPSILSDEWMLIGRQEATSAGGVIDLLAIAPDGALVLIELKRDRTPREVVAQALDYACWVENLQSEDIAGIYDRFRPIGNLTDDFLSKFGQPLDEETVNESHQIVIVAASLDPSTERIVGYLNQRDIGINVLCFQVFEHNDAQLLSRSWLLDPAETQLNVAASAKGAKEPWNGEFYACFGDNNVERDWEEARKYGFICAGGGTWYTNTLNLLTKGERVWVKAPGHGFVGVGQVMDPRQSANEYRIEGRPALDVLVGGTYHRDVADDEDECEYFVPIKWLQTVSLNDAVNGIGMFGNQNTVCKPKTPKWRTTVEQLKRRFTNFDSDQKPMAAE